MDLFIHSVSVVGSQTKEADSARRNSPARGESKEIEGVSSGNNGGHKGSQNHSGFLSLFYWVLSPQESIMKLGPDNDDNESRTFT